MRKVKIFDDLVYEYKYILIWKSLNFIIKIVNNIYLYVKIYLW